MAESKSLDARIAKAISSNGTADRDKLAALCTEAAKAIEELQATISREEARVLDLDNLDPDKSTALIASSRIRIERYSKAIAELEPRIAVIDREAMVVAWVEQAERLQHQSDDLYRELTEIYPPFLQRLMDLHRRIAANDAAFSALCHRVPAEVDPSAFLRAAPYADFWRNMRMPSWNNPGLTYPERAKPVDPIAEIALASAAFAKRWDAKVPMTPEAHQAELDKKEAEQKAKADADREAFYRSVAEADRRRMRGGV